MACMYKVRIAQKVEGGSDKRHETQRTAINTEPKYRPRPERERGCDRTISIETETTTETQNTQIQGQTRGQRRKTTDKK